MAPKTQLQKHIETLVTKYGTLRAAGEALDVDHTLLWRIKKGKRTSASDETLKKLGFVRVVTVERI